MSYLDLTFPWFDANIKNVVPKGEISLRQLINATINPKPKVRQAFLDIQKAADDGDLKLKDKLKQENLFFTTPSVRLKYRNYDSIDEFLPFAVFEYDKIPCAEELKQYIFEKFPSCIFAFLSPSKTGCKFIFHISKPSSIKGYKELFYGIAYDLDKFVGHDLSTSRVVQALFNSWDEGALFREDAIPSTRRGFITNSFNANTPIDFEIPENIDKDLEEKILGRLNDYIDNIEDSAHNKILSFSFLLGGWCGANLIGEELAYETLKEAIFRNEYMSKDPNGYMRTAKDMFYKGINHPIEFR